MVPTGGYGGRRDGLARAEGGFGPPEQGTTPDRSERVACKTVTGHCMPTQRGGLQNIEVLRQYTYIPAIVGFRKKPNNPTWGTTVRTAPRAVPWKHFLFESGQDSNIFIGSIYERRSGVVGLESNDERWEAGPTRGGTI